MKNRERNASKGGKVAKQEGLDQHDSNVQTSVRNEWCGCTDYIKLKWSNLSELAILVDALRDSSCH